MSDSGNIVVASLVLAGLGHISWWVVVGACALRVAFAVIEAATS